MGRHAHRPGGLWFVLQRVRLTKPPQIAMAYGLGPRRPRNGHASCECVPTRGDWCRFHAAGCGSGVRSTGRRMQDEHEGASSWLPARMESASDLGKSGSQGSMNNYVHRPCFPWFAHLRVRLTKPPQIAAAHGLGPRWAHNGHSSCERVPTRGDWCRFRAAGRGLRARSTGRRPQGKAEAYFLTSQCGRKSLRRLRRWLGRGLAPCGKAAVKGRWAGMPIDPLAYGSLACAFALRNLHESPWPTGWAHAGPTTGIRAASAYRPAAIGAGFVRLAAGCARVRPAGARAVPCKRAARAATPPRRLHAAPEMVTSSV